MLPLRRDGHGERKEFDPAMEGARHGLSREMSLAIWVRACADATDEAGRRDLGEARRRFNEMASRAAANGGRHRPDVGRMTRVGVELERNAAWTSGPEELVRRTPGRVTLVATEASRWTQVSGELATALEDVTSASQRTDDLMGRRKLAGASDVIQVFAVPQHSPQPDQPGPSRSAHAPSSRLFDIDLAELPALGHDPRDGGWLPPANTTAAARAAALPAAVMRSAEHDQVDAAAAELVERARHGGTPLDEPLRTRLEIALGARLDGVRVHTDVDADAAARALGARAFAIGNDVFFRSGTYDPRQRDGQRLIAHEVAHTVQARGAPAPTGGEPAVSQPDDAPEREADAFADAFVRSIDVRRDEPAGPTAHRASSDRAPPEAQPASGQRPPDANVQPPSGVSEPCDVRELATNAFAGRLVRGGPVSSASTRAGLIYRDPKPDGPAKLPRTLEEAASLKDALPIKGDPAKNPLFIENKVKAVGVEGLGGPFTLFPEVTGDVPAGKIFLDRKLVSLETDPLAGFGGSLNLVYATRAAAEAAVAKMGVAGLYSYYMGPGGFIYPTVISATTAPRLIGTLRSVREKEREDALATRDAFIALAFWYVGARVPIKTKTAPAAAASAGLEGFTAAERAIITEAKGILSSKEIATIRAAFEARKSVTVKIAGRVIQYEPGLPASGMTMFGENGFLIGREAFASEAELSKTVLHELYRLTTSVAKTAGVTAESAAAETKAAADFAEKGYAALKGAL